MLTIERTVTMSPEQYDIVIEGMRNPLNSWDKSDSEIIHIENPHTLETADYEFLMGDADLGLMTNLHDAGTDHRKFLRMMPVWVTITAPLYWWKEFDTYKIGTVANSCSTMHKIHDKEFMLEDFSCEHLIDKHHQELIDCDVPNGLNILSDDEFGALAMVCCGTFHDGHSFRIARYFTQKDVLHMFIIPALNANRESYLKTKDKRYWWQMIQLLPSSYNQKRTVFLNYEVLNNIYRARKNHKLDEWRVLCHWIEQLPYADKLIVGGVENG